MKSKDVKKKDSLELIKELSEVFGPPGCEDEVRSIIRSHMPDGVKISEDKIGNIICRKDGSKSTPAIMLTAHMDEIGFMVSGIDDNGFLRIVPLGGWWPVSVIDKKWTILGKKGKLTGVSNCFNAHIVPDGFKKSVEAKDIFIDIGMQNRTDVMNAGISIGNFVVPQVEMFSLADSNVVCGKAFDDRVGCALMLDVVDKINGMTHPNTLFIAGSSQEEVGSRGINSVVNSVRFDAAIVLEIVPALDSPGNYRDDLPECRTGKGPVLHMLDSGSIINRPFIRLAEKIASKAGIPLQYWVSPGVSNDGKIIQRSYAGVPVLIMAVPLRYMHGHLSIMHMDDYMNALELLLLLIRKLDAKAVDSLSGSGQI